MERNYELIKEEGAKAIKAWTKGVQFEVEARQQVLNVARMPFIHAHVAVMPDVHAGIGATVGSVIPTLDAIIPAAVGVDIGCGMMAVKTTLKAEDLPDNLKGLRTAIENAVPHGRTDNGGSGDRGSWTNPPAEVEAAWMGLEGTYKKIAENHKAIGKARSGSPIRHLGTLGTGNHFIEMCLDEGGGVWFMLHSGSRGIGNKIGTYFIELAKEDMRRYHINLPNEDLAYLPEGTEHFREYVQAVEWAQAFAMENRQVMMGRLLARVRATGELPPFEADVMAVNCHHNYVNREYHYGKNVFVTRKGAVSARTGELGIIPGSMGARSYIVRGKGNPESFHSCSHGAGRMMSRTEARKRFTLEDHVRATEGVECRKDADVIDETPAAYKPIDDVMAAQADLVEVVHTLKQVLCVKG